jgi:hypothetical protein
VFGLAVLAALAGYLALAVWATSKARGWWKLPLASAWVALPTWDAVLGRMSLDAACEKGLQLQVVATVEPSTTIYRSGIVFEDSPKFYGYRVIEGTPRKPAPTSPWGHPLPGKYVSRATLKESGEVLVEDVVEGTAIYGLFEERLSSSGRLASTKHYVKNIQDGRELGHFTSHYFRGGWVERALAAGGGAGKGCAVATHEKEKELLSRTVPAK